jgi:steroid delta-isomerase-like uncharacterized protein
VFSKTLDGLTYCPSNIKGDDPMSEENKALMRRFIDVYNARNVDIFDDLVAKDHVDHHIPPELPKGPEGVKVYFKELSTSFPDSRIKIEDMFAEGDKVAIRFVFAGTHQGELMGIPATGKQFSISGIAIGRFTGGQLVEWWENADSLSLMQQLGLIPAMGEPA